MPKPEDYTKEELELIVESCKRELEYKNKKLTELFSEVHETQKALFWAVNTLKEKKE